MLVSPLFTATFSTSMPMSFKCGSFWFISVMEQLLLSYFWQGRNNHTLNQPHFKNNSFSDSFVICLSALYFAPEEKVRETGLLSNTQWDAFDTVRNNLVLVQGVPETCQPDLGFFCWGTGISESPTQLTVTEAGWWKCRNYRHTHRHMRVCTSKGKHSGHEHTSTYKCSSCQHEKCKHNLINMHTCRTDSMTAHPYGYICVDTLSHLITPLAHKALVRPQEKRAQGEVS